MKKIFLSNGGFTLISDEDFLYLVGYTWSYNNKGGIMGHVDGKTQYISRVIAKRMGLDLSNIIDHEDRNPLNNQRNNLRSATQSQNRANSKRNKSGYKGVDYKNNHWRAQIRASGKQIHLGYFDSPKKSS